MLAGARNDSARPAAVSATVGSEAGAEVSTVAELGARIGAAAAGANEENVPKEGIEPMLPMLPLPLDG
jgi:hypothetical protein